MRKSSKGEQTQQALTRLRTQTYTVDAVALILTEHYFKGFFIIIFALGA